MMLLFTSRGQLGGCTGELQESRAVPSNLIATKCMWLFALKLIEIKYH